MADRLAELGKPMIAHELLAPRPRGQSLGRPVLAKALVKAGHVADTRQAFDTLIGDGQARVRSAARSQSRRCHRHHRPRGRHRVARASGPVEARRPDSRHGRRRPDRRRGVSQRARRRDDRALSRLCRASWHSRVRRLRLSRRKRAAAGGVRHRRAAARSIREAEGARQRGRADGGGTADGDLRVDHRHRRLDVSRLSERDDRGARAAHLDRHLQHDDHACWRTR